MVWYLQQTAEKCYANNISMMKFFNKTDFSYLLGEDIFVMPIISAQNTLNINFPAGNNWVYLYNEKQEFQGGTNATLTFPLNEYPVFVKKNSKVSWALGAP